MDQAVKEIISNKRVNLSAPGYQLNDLYPNLHSSMVEDVEAVYSTGRYVYSLQAPNFNSTSSIIIPNSSFLGEVYLHAELPALQAGQYVGSGFLYNAIGSVSYIFGSSNVPQIVLSGESVKELAMLECDTKEKRDTIIKLAGQPNYFAAVTPQLTQKADIVLPMPFSSLAGLFPPHFYDSNILQNPLTIQVTFNPVSYVYGTSTGVLPTGFSRCAVYLRLGDLTDKSYSLRNVLRLNPEDSLNYGFIHHQTLNTPKFIGIKESDQSRVSIPVQGLINADLVAMSIHAVADADLANGNSFNWAQLSNIELQYNGLVYYAAPGEMYRLANMAGGAVGSCSSAISTVNASGVVASPIIEPVLFNFTRLKSFVFRNRMANTWRLPNNTLQLYFNTVDNASYTLFITVHYNGVISAQNGQANIYFD